MDKFKRAKLMKLERSLTALRDNSLFYSEETNRKINELLLKIARLKQKKKYNKGISEVTIDINNLKQKQSLW
jgi:hypothetical protein